MKEGSGFKPIPPLLATKAQKMRPIVPKTTHGAKMTHDAKTRPMEPKTISKLPKHGTDGTKKETHGTKNEIHGVKQ